MNRPAGQRIREVSDDIGGTIAYRPSRPLYGQQPVDTAAAQLDPPTQELTITYPEATPVSPIFADATHPSDVLAVVADELAAAEQGARRWAQALADMRAGLVVLHRDALATLARIT